jgi:hypothetical protein
MKNQLPSDASSDQSNCPDGYYRRSNGMLHELSLQSNGAVVIPGLSDDDLRSIAREKLSELLQSIDAKQSPSLLLSVAREVMDRIEGKPTQRIEQRVQHVGKGMAGDMTTEELLMAVRGLADAGRLPSGVKLLADGKLDVVDAEFEEVDTNNQ